MKYLSLEQALQALKVQAVDSLPAAERLNLQGTPAEIFSYLKTVLKYVPDPRGNELLQQLDTLLNDNGMNKHGVAGAGDCDCFTIAALAVLYNAGYTNLYVTIAGNFSDGPSHVYPELLINKKYYTFDLTEPYYNKRRSYVYFQRLKFSFT